MELFKEITMFGLDFIKAKKGVRISKEEIEAAQKICINVGKKIDKTADFINKNQLAEPILSGASKIFKTILCFCGLVFILAVLILIFADSLITNLVILVVLMLLGRLLMFVSVIVALIVLLIGYAKIKK
jgi:hypothetical protein